MGFLLENTSAALHLQSEVETSNFSTTVEIKLPESSQSQDFLRT